MFINQLNTNGLGMQSQSSTTSVNKASIADMQAITSTESKVAKNTLESEEQIKQAVQKIQETTDKLTQNLHFSIDEETGKTVIKVIDVHTDEVIRQIPSKEAIEIARTLDKVQGLLFNDKA